MFADDRIVEKVMFKLSTLIPESISRSSRSTRRYSVMQVLNAKYLKWIQESAY